jgi:cyanate permease
LVDHVQIGDVAAVLLPSLLKRDFPNQITKLTAIYALTMGGAAALGSVGAIPLARLLAWPHTLDILFLLPLVSAIVSLPQLRKHSAPAQGTATPRTEDGSGIPHWHGRSRCSWGSIPLCITLPRRGFPPY